MFACPSATSISLDNLFEMADRIVEVSAPSVSAVYPQATPPVPTEVDSLRS